MKSFFEMINDWNFALALIAAFLIAGYDLAYGTKIIGTIFLFLIMGAIALNIWKTRKKS
ncbi:hypothetical protein K8R43_01095 [archaeon]|nr:hypothetical protein [archaeon]